LESPISLEISALALRTVSLTFSFFAIQSVPPLELTIT
jgi:hypothetical protein